MKRDTDKLTQAVKRLARQQGAALVGVATVVAEWQTRGRPGRPR